MEQKYTTETLKHGNVEIVVYRPVLDDKERARREKEVQRALAQFGREVVKMERKEKRNANIGSL